MIRIIAGDCREKLKEFEPESVQCCVTSPPYFGLRDYGIPATVWDGDGECEHEWGDEITVNATNYTDKRRWQHTRNGRDEEQPIEKRVALLRTEVAQGKFCQKCNGWVGSLGLEPTPELYISHIVSVFREVWRVLRDDGTLWLNLGDSYAAGKTGRADNGPAPSGLKSKDLCMIPARVALALQAAGWWLRSEIVWHKVNCMPESVDDRPTKAHEMIYLLAKSARYYYDADAIKEPASGINYHDLTGCGYNAPGQTPQNGNRSSWKGSRFDIGKTGEHQLGRSQKRPPLEGSHGASGMDGNGMRNKRSVWTVATQPYDGAHFATFPEDLVKPCILAGSRPGDTILDPFAGSGTTGKVAIELGRRAALIELNPGYIKLADRRTDVTPGMF